LCGHEKNYPPENRFLPAGNETCNLRARTGMFPGRTGAGKNDEPVNRKKGEFIIPVTGDTGSTPYTPFLVVGSGIAGLYTALKLAETGEVTLVTKETLVESTTAYAQGGIAAALNPGDSPNLHFDDTIKAGAGLCLSKAVRILVQEGMERVKELLDLGVPFDRRDGEPAFTREAAHSRRRILHADGDATGREISRVLMELVTRNPRIKVEEKVFAAALLTGSAGCRGIFTVRKNGAPQALLAGATILATGGCKDSSAGKQCLWRTVFPDGKDTAAPRAAGKQSGGKDLFFHFDPGIPGYQFHQYPGDFTTGGVTVGMENTPPAVGGFPGKRRFAVPAVKGNAKIQQFFYSFHPFLNQNTNGFGKAKSGAGFDGVVKMKVR